MNTNKNFRERHTKFSLNKKKNYSQFLGVFTLEWKNLILISKVFAFISKA